jgi:UDP-GlcNAc:undecaprenyl-phosphate GlcNAc-1-phosphate transferase
MSDYAQAFGFALVASIVLTFLVREFARRRGLVARPRKDRWHAKPTALFGGVAIALAFFVGLALAPEHDARGGSLFVACAAAMFVLGVVDDFLNLSPHVKLVGQIVIATVMTAFGMRLHWLSSPALDLPLTILWLVGITNALNLLDNIDGAAGGVALIAACFVAYFSDRAGLPGVATLASAFAGAVAGFLLFNFNPASIFMGDGGSLFLGFFLAGIAMVDHQPGARRKLLGVLLVPVLLLLIPILDTALVTFSRSMHGRAVSQGGRDHTSHRLVSLGLSERAASLTLWILSAVSGLVALLAQTLSQAVAALIVPLFAVLVLFFFVLLGRVKVYEVTELPPASGSSVPPTNRSLLPSISDFAYKRRLFEIACDAFAIVLAYYGAYLLRFDARVVEPYYGQMLRSMPVVLVSQLATFLVLGLYSTVWRYTSVRDLMALLRAGLGGWVASVLIVTFLFRFEGLSRSAFVIDGLLLIIGLTATRASVRWFQSVLAYGRTKAAAPSKRTLIYGAGDGGELVVRELLNNPALGFLPVGFLDDDPRKHGRKIHGVPILGSLERLAELLPDRADHVVLSTDKIGQEARERLDEVCRGRGVVPLRMRIAIDVVGS